MKKWLFSFVAVPLLLVGCSGEQAEPVNEPIDVSALEVKVDILTPEQVDVNVPVELAAHVHQNNQNLDDASVKFEVWESGFRNSGQMIDGTLDADGVYKAEFTFDHDGVYYMYAHTTASNGMHVMPKQQIVAGYPDMDNVKPDESGNSTDMGEHGDSSETDADHGEDGGTADGESEHGH